MVLAGVKENVDEHLCAADLFVLPSLWEGLSLALVEAACVGLPLVATDVGVSSQIVKDGVTGYLLKPGSSRALVEKISQMLRLTEEQREEMGINARELTREKFSLEKMVGEYERLYEDLMPGRANV